MWIIVSSLADLAEFFAAVPKTEQGGGWLVTKFALRRGRGAPNHNQAEHIPARSILDMASGRQANERVA